MGELRSIMATSEYVAAVSSPGRQRLYGRADCSSGRVVGQLGKFTIAQKIPRNRRTFAFVGLWTMSPSPNSRPEALDEDDERALEKLLKAPRKPPIRKLPRCS